MAWTVLLVVFAVAALVALAGVVAAAAFVALAVAFAARVALDLLEAVLAATAVSALLTATLDAWVAWGVLIARGTLIMCGALIVLGAFIAPPAIAPVAAQRPRMPIAVPESMSFMMHSLVMRMIAESYGRNSISPSIDPGLETESPRKSHVRVRNASAISSNDPTTSVPRKNTAIPFAMAQTGWRESSKE